MISKILRTFTAFSKHSLAISLAVMIVLLPAVVHAHHGPGMRGYNPGKTIVISGVITKCFECGNGSKGHGVVSIMVGSQEWEATLPDTPSLRKSKISLTKLKKGTAVKVTGFAHQSNPHRIYASEIIANGVTVLRYDDREERNDRR